MKAEQRLDLTSLQRALDSLHRALQEPKNEFVRDSAIQRFEYTYELSWKFLKRYLEQDEGIENVDGLHRKDLFRLAAEKGLIVDPSEWFEFHLARNQTTQTYSEAKADEVYEATKTFLPRAQQLLQELTRRCHD